VITCGGGQSPDLYSNDGDGQFTLESTGIVCQSEGSGGASWGDYDNDGDMDLFMGYSSGGPSYLFQNNGDGTFVEASGHGLGIYDGRSFAGVWGDYDNDGDLDIYLWLRDSQSPDSAKGFLFENLGDGSFSRVTTGVIAEDTCTTTAAVWGDFDRDGDLDLYLANYDPYNQGIAQFLKNDLFRNNGNGNHWIIIKPIGTVSNQSAIGTKVRLKASIGGSDVWQLREMTGQSGSSAQPPLELHFGLGDATVIDSLKLEWPGGIVQALTDVAVDQFLTITEDCCGIYTAGYTGNTNCSADGKLTLSDISHLIDRVYISKAPLCCEANGNTNGSEDDKITLSDITQLIDRVYISKEHTAACE
jgi:hypothetical protein